MDKNVLDSFSGSQRNAIEKFFDRDDNGQNKPSDIRLSFGRFFVTILWGREKRGSERLERERSEHPVFTLRKMPVVAAIWLSILFTGYSVAALAFRALSALLLG
ncbi:MAG: hypothetical protein R3D02_05440 [Hyphomicrobiales bacterium]